MITALGVTLFLGIWALFLIVEVITPRYKRRKLRKACKAACKQVSLMVLDQRMKDK